MKRPDVTHPLRTGYTLVEILVATTLALLLMGAVAVMFGRVGESITDSRSMLEAADRLRLAQARLQMDLAGVTATVSPPLKPENNQGYFEYIEGPAIAGANGSSGIARNTDAGVVDTTVGDFDDILMFTTRTTGKPFVGRCGTLIVNGQPVTPGTIQSDVAEVAWFLRGRTLHRRVLLVAPSASFPSTVTAAGFYVNYDISARWVNGGMKANTLGDLTRPQLRFAHPFTVISDVRRWYWTINGNSAQFPTLPTICECSGATASGAWSTEQAPLVYPQLPTALDFWTNIDSNRVPGSALLGAGGTPGTRISDDIILTNVIGFDVKAWDPAAPNGAGGLGAYVDLGYGDPNGLGHYGQTITGTDHTARIYDTWSTTYFGDLASDGIDRDPLGASNGIVDDDGEKINPPPYPIPLRGIQVRIRVFEPDSMQIREVTVVQDFLPR